jgi:hypothetical protein
MPAADLEACPDLRLSITVILHPDFLSSYAVIKPTIPEPMIKHSVIF